MSRTARAKATTPSTQPSRVRFGVETPLETVFAMPKMLGTL